MRAIVTVETKKAREKIRRVLQSGPSARRAAVVAMVRAIMQRVEVAAPRDTNRYVRAWMQAANMAGVGPFAVPNVVPAKHRDAIYEAILEQERFWGMIVQRYESQRRYDKWYRQAQKKLERAREQIRKFFESEEADGGMIAMNLRINRGGKPGYGQWGFGKGMAKEIRILNKVYGGEGRLLEGSHSTTVHLRNKEPHASIVEYNHKVMSRAYAAFRGTGLHKIKTAYVSRAMEKAS